MKKTISLVLILSVATMFIFTGCGASNTVKGGAIGAAAGGILGGIIGDNNGNTTAGVLIGAAVGGVAGGLIGNYMDKQAEEIQKDIEGAKVERVGEGIKITFDSGILFATNSSRLQSEAKINIEKLSVILKKYDDTNILVTGHTDADGSEEYNKNLSEKRAESVADYTKIQGVNGNRISTVGLGESEPVASNKTSTGKRENRRVEIAIFANEDLKEAAEEGNI